MRRVLTVVFTMAAAITLLPAMFGYMGVRVLSKKERRRLAAGELSDGHESSLLVALGRLRRAPPGDTRDQRPARDPASSPAPSSRLRLGSSDEGNDPAGSTTRKAYDLLAGAFGPGSNGPLLLVAEIGSPADQAALAKLDREAEQRPRRRRRSPDAVGSRRQAGPDPGHPQDRTAGQGDE